MAGQEKSSLRKKRPLGENARYEEHYESADGIEIVGIACRGFWKSLYPCYGERDLLAQVTRDPQSRKGRLAHLKSTVLFKNLQKRNFHVAVYMANPFSKFVQTRAEEEENPQCMNDILSGIELLALLVEDLREAGSSLKFGIQGSFRVFLYDKNPYVSVFRAWHKDGRDDYLAVGLLFQHRRGYDTPQVIVRGSAAEPFLLQAVSDHIASFQATTLLKWEKNLNEIVFNYSYSKAGRFDVFLCYNHSDKRAVHEIALRLRERGILPWLDDWVLDQGNWVDALEDALEKVDCVAVFAGPNGAGPWQELEIRLSLDRSAHHGLRVIPVVLKGVKGDPPWTTGFLRLFQRVDFRRQDPDPVLHLVGMIRGSARPCERT